MKYFNLNGSVSAYEDDGSQDHLIKPGMFEMTAAEVELHKNPPAPEKSIQDKIDDLENSVTKRNYREYLKGIREPSNPDYKYSTDKIDKVDTEITKLRP